MSALVKPDDMTVRAWRKLTRQQRWWHEALADFLVANPMATNQDCANYLGNQRTASTIGLIKNTDTFKALLAARRAELKETMDAAIISKLTGVTYSAFDAILDKLNKKRDTLPMNELTDALATVNKFIGGGPKPGGVTVNVNTPAPTMIPVPVSVADLAEAQAALRRHQSSLSAAQAPVIEQTTVEVETEKVAAAQPASDPGTT